MGMYTGLRFKVHVKEKYQKALEKMLEGYTWTEIEGIPKTKDWLMVGRCDFIPWGMLCYMPVEWDDELEKEMNDQHSVYENGIWRVICSLKNYNNEIDYFVHNILSELVDEVYYCESLYEEYPEEPTIYTLEDMRGETCID